MKRSQKRFTLVELLVVIGIIAVLAGILLPTISIAIKKVRVSRARTEISGLMTAMRMFESEYDLLPITYDDTVDSYEMNSATAPVITYDELVAVLSQTGTQSSTLNPRKIKMLDVKKAGEYKDPWKNPSTDYDNDYHIVVDSDANDEITSNNVVGMATGQTLLYNIIIWSAGPDGQYSSTPDASVNKDNVYSMETNWDPNNGHVIP
jgi:prepilin-type N-terminal cleavage/methylation domain-containing protein